MNRPCRIYFHEDAAPSVAQLPPRYRSNVETDATYTDHLVALLVQNAFYVDYAHGSIVRTRVGGSKNEDPVDFPLASISHVEWFYGDDIPEALVPWTDPNPARNGQRN